MRFRPALLALAASLLSACSLTSHATRPSTLGVARSSADLLAVLEQPGPLEVESIASADWTVPLGGLVNLDHPRAKEAGLKDRDEPIQVFFHVLRHPERGTFIVDTGIERALRDDQSKSAIGSLVRSVMHVERMKAREPLGDWLARQPAPLAGVLLTHLHLDHVSGMPDVPKGTPIYAGAGEAQERAFQNLVLQATMNRELEGQAPIEEWQFQRDAAGRFDGVLDVFGDGSLWALSVPGHTPGSTAYLARTTSGPVLFVGDTSHTVWGWDHDVEPGEYTGDHAKNAESLARLRTLVQEHPAIQVRFGHQTR